MDSIKKISLNKYIRFLEILQYTVICSILPIFAGFALFSTDDEDLDLPASSSVIKPYIILAIIYVVCILLLKFYKKYFVCLQDKEISSIDVFWPKWIFWMIIVFLLLYPIVVSLLLIFLGLLSQ